MSWWCTKTLQPGMVIVLDHSQGVCFRPCGTLWFCVQPHAWLAEGRTENRTENKLAVDYCDLMVAEHSPEPCLQGSLFLVFAVTALPGSSVIPLAQQVYKKDNPLLFETFS